MKDWFEVPLVDVGAEHALDGLHVGETVGGLDEFAEEVPAPKPATANTVTEKPVTEKPVTEKPVTEPRP